MQLQNFGGRPPVHNYNQKPPRGPHHAITIPCPPPDFVGAFEETMATGVSVMLPALGMFGKGYAVAGATLVAGAYGYVRGLAHEHKSPGATALKFASIACAGTTAGALGGLPAFAGWGGLTICATVVHRYGREDSPYTP